MSRPRPTPVMHFTHVDNLPSVVSHGLMSDSRVALQQLLEMEVGNAGIQRQRARRSVLERCGGGVVADFVPFYFAPRSPMMFRIGKSGVNTSDLVYLVSSLEYLVACGLKPVLTDRNAALDYAEFISFRGERLPADFIDWPLMRERLRYDTPSDPQRKERR